MFIYQRLFLSFVLMILGQAFSPRSTPHRFLKPKQPQAKNNVALFSVSESSLAEETFRERYNQYIPEWLLGKLEQCGWERPTMIQQAALDTLLATDDLGNPIHDAVIQAETGSGKTLSFLIPALSCVDPTRSSVQAMIIVPTRELGLQVSRVAKRLAAGSQNNNNDKLMVMSVLQGSTNKRQRAWAWAEPPHVVIGTPHEISLMVSKGGIKRYNNIKFLVVDEVDACLLNNAGDYTRNLEATPLHGLLSKYLSPTFDDGSSSELDDRTSILSSSTLTMKRPLQLRQTVFASATIPQPRHFLKQCMQNQWTLRDPVHVSLRRGEQLLPMALKHTYLVCQANKNKVAALRRLLQKIFKESQGDDGKPQRVLIFADASRPLEDIAKIVANDFADGIYWTEAMDPSQETHYNTIAAVLRYEDSLTIRAAALDSFRGYHNSLSDEEQKPPQPALRVLLSTDLAARGLDIPDITHVINFDLPQGDADTYVHRAGRSGRFGRPGTVVSMITPEQEFVLSRLANKLSLETTCVGRQRASSSATED